MEQEILHTYLSSREPSVWPVSFSIVSRTTGIPSTLTDESDRAVHCGRVLNSVKWRHKHEKGWRTVKVDMRHICKPRYWRMFFFGTEDDQFFDPKDHIILLRCIDHVDGGDPAADAAEPSEAAQAAPSDGAETVGGATILHRVTHSNTSLNYYSLPGQ